MPTFNNLAAIRRALEELGVVFGPDNTVSLPSRAIRLPDRSDST